MAPLSSSEFRHFSELWRVQRRPHSLAGGYQSLLTQAASAFQQAGDSVVQTLANQVAAEGRSASVHHMVANWWAAWSGSTPSFRASAIRSSHVRMTKAAPAQISSVTTLNRTASS